MRSSLLSHEVIADEDLTDSPGTRQIEILDPEAKGAGSPFIGLTSRLFLGAAPLKTIAVVACRPREGVTHVSRGLRNFLTLKMNLRSTLLTADECLTAFPYREESELVTAGAKSPDRQPEAELIGSALLLNKVVLIDCPPLSSSASVLRVAPYVDGILLVVEDGKRTKAEILRAVETIEAARGRVVGIVLNKRRYLLPKWLYSILYN